ncbi:hypothetical protein Tco_1232973 [Tanacetum coccineum]
MGVSHELRWILRVVYHVLCLGEKALAERENVGLDLTKFDLFPSFIEDLTAKGMRVADSHAGEDGFTPLETIRRFLSIMGSKSLLVSKGRPSSWRGWVLLQKRSQTILDAPLGFIGLYTHHFTLSNLRDPIPKCICKVLNYFKVYISRFNPFGMVKLTTFAVMCKAYGGEPSVDLLRAFLNLGPASDWLTLSNRGGSGIPKALTKPITHIEGWKGSFFFIKNKIIPFKYSELLLEDNKLDKKSFKDVIPLHI